MKNITLTILALLALSISLYAGESKTAESGTVDLQISGMTCESCAQKVKTSLEKVDGVSGVDVALTTKSASVTFDANKTNLTKLQEAVHAAGCKIEATQANNDKSCCNGNCTCNSSCTCSSSCSCCAAHKTNKI